MYRDNVIDDLVSTSHTLIVFICFVQKGVVDAKFHNHLLANPLTGRMT